MSSVAVTEAVEVVIVGAGPTGLACGIALGKLGVKALLFDKGCVVNSLYNYPTNMLFFTTPELLEIGDIPMTAIGEKPTRTEALKYYRRVADHYKLQIRQETRVLHIDGADGAFEVVAEDRWGNGLRVACKKVIFATGYYDIPNRMGVPGEELPKVLHYYKEPHPYYNRDVLVVGAKNSAAIAALELWWTGARVTLVHRGEGIHQHVKYWIKPNIENRIKNGEIKSYFRSTVKEILPESVVLNTPEGEVRLVNDTVFALVGYRPDFAFLESHGIGLDSESGKPRVNPETFESETPGIYLAGVIVAGVHTNEIFIENGRFHGTAIASSIAAKLQG